jgi:hypothetical protein
MNRSTALPSSVLALVLASLFALPPAHAQAVPAGPQALAGEVDPVALQRELAASRLDLERAVTVKKVKLAAGLGTLHLDDGILVPATAVGGKTAEMVFVGSGRLELEPPDEIEAGQLDLFTGSQRLDEEVTEVALVLGMDAAVQAVLRRPKATLDAQQTARCEEVWKTWKGGAERRHLGVETALLLDAVGDPTYQSYFAARFLGKERGKFLYVVEPGSREQVTLGHFVPLEASDKEKRKIHKEISRQQRRGRLIGLELDDLGQWDTWVSATLRGRDGKPFPGNASFEPRKYTLELNVAEDLDVSGRARIELAPVVRGSRAVVLRLFADLNVTKVTDGSGRTLFFSRTREDLAILLPGPVADDETVTLAVEYEGKLINKTEGSFALAETGAWYPRAGTTDRAQYDVTFRWPKKLDLLAGGRRAGGGEEGDVRWERRVLDFPAATFSFEVGRYKIETIRAGHVQVTLALDPDVKQMGKEAREEIKKTVADSLIYFEELFGPYPLDELAVVTVPRGFSQAAAPGLVTLSSLMMYDLEFFNVLFGLEDRRTVIAHEIAHQWWGHTVGWASYRDQWISEAMANYAAVLFGRNRLEWEDRYGLRPTSRWQSELLGELPDGRVIESVGPVVLGVRLISSRSGDAYQPIVYKKGAVILDMLARSLGQEDFPKVLRQIVKVAANASLSTEDFLGLIERITSADLDPFARQYIYGTGLPEVYYSYRFEPAGEEKWVVKGTARQNAPYRFRYSVVKSREEGKKRGKEKLANAMARTHILLRGTSTEFAIDLQQDPRDFWLDQNQEVFGRFFNENRSPKRILYYQGIDAAAAGNAAEAESLLSRALAAEVEVVADPATASDKQDLKREGRLLDAMIELLRARLWLDQGRDSEARGAFDRCRKVLAGAGWFEESLAIVESRLDLRSGAPERAFKRLKKGVLRRGTVEGTEGYVLLAIAAHATGNREELKKALEVAKENGADVSLLAAASAGLPTGR